MLYVLVLVAIVSGLFIHWPMHKGYAPGGYFCVLDGGFNREWICVCVWNKHRILMRGPDGSIISGASGVWDADAVMLCWNWRFWNRK